MIAKLEPLTKDPALQKKLGQAARHTIEDSFSWEKISDEYIQLFKTITPAETTQ